MRGCTKGCVVRRKAQLALHDRFVIAKRPLLRKPGAATRPICQRQSMFGARAPARAKIRVHVKRLLKKYGYPPDLQDSAVQNVLRQAEALSTELAA